MDPVVVLGLANLVLKYGLEAATKMVVGLNTKTPTIEQIEALSVKPPMWYFKQYPKPPVLKGGDLGEPKNGKS